MLSRTNQGPRGSVKSGRFEALLDKLVAVQMDLEPVCGVGTERTQVAASLVAIADACSVLRSAIADVRNIIHQTDGLLDLPEAVPAND
jgi:ribonuclease PH